ncbi:hypothetical protein [Kocuria aegyptia]|uniref:Uncharacterized protein n=1 Tax=Kocuria aegyptia TaxID=330943 RepID=A0ABP4WLD3_9MICC
MGAPANGLFRAINGALVQAEDRTWGDFGILVADPAMTVRLGQQQRLKSRGVRTGTSEQAARARSFHGVMIAYCRDHPMLTTAEALQPRP